MVSQPCPSQPGMQLPFLHNWGTVGAPYSELQVTAGRGCLGKRGFQ